MTRPRLSAQAPRVHLDSAGEEVMESEEELSDNCSECSECSICDLSITSEADSDSDSDDTDDSMPELVTDSEAEDIFCRQSLSAMNMMNCYMDDVSIISPARCNNGHADVPLPELIWSDSSDSESE